MSPISFASWSGSRGRGLRRSVIAGVSRLARPRRLLLGLPALLGRQVMHVLLVRHGARPGGLRRYVGRPARLRAGPLEGRVVSALSFPMHLSAALTARSMGSAGTGGYDERKRNLFKLTHYRPMVQVRPIRRAERSLVA
jgi:hypothetical protein